MNLQVRRPTNHVSGYTVDCEELCQAPRLSGSQELLAQVQTSGILALGFMGVEGLGV